MKKQSGITLVSLVITIIVMLILAGVSISLVVGDNGVLTQASDSVLEQKVATVKEQLNLALAATETIYYSNWTSDISITRNGTDFDYVGTLKTQLSNSGYTAEVPSTIVGTTGQVTITDDETGEAFVFSSVVVDADTGAATISGTVTVDGVAVE